MVADAIQLPREPDILIGIIVALREENSRLQAMLETARRALYGTRFEKLDGNAAQLPLGLEDVSTIPAEPASSTPRPSSQDGPLRPKPSRNIGGLPKHLPREDVVLEPVIKFCPCCRGTLHRIGEDVGVMLDIVPTIIQFPASF